jgi:hypothetical protein
MATTRPQYSHHIHDESNQHHHHHHHPWFVLLAACLVQFNQGCDISCKCGRGASKSRRRRHGGWLRPAVSIILIIVREVPAF